jgi:hypothetical protein
MAPDATPPSGVLVTIREIFERVVQLGVKVDVLLAQQNDASKDVADHESRLRALERNRWPLPAVTVLVALAALVVSVIGAVRG